MKKILLIILALVIVSACVKKPKLILKKSNFEYLKNWNEENHKQLLSLYVNSCTKIDKKGWHKFFEQLSLVNLIKKNDYLNCIKAKNYSYSNNSARKFIESNFVPYLVKNNEDEEGLFTGYYELALNGSLERRAPYIYPIYGLPQNIGKFTREQIEEGALEGKKLELAYTDDPIRLFFLHIQGSGVVMLDNKKRLPITYAGQNGYKYFSIGKYLTKIEGIDKEKLNAEFIINWLKDYNFKAKEILNQNKSYIYFRINNNESPIGAMQLPLTSERSLAIDRNFLPLGAMMWVETKYPNSDNLFLKGMVTQDTGGAIKGPVRGDIYFGSGSLAEENAYHMKSRGKYYILLPKEMELADD